VNTNKNFKTKKYLRRNKMSVSVYINFKGNCREAVDFYADAFQVQKQQIMTFGDAPADPNFPFSEETKKLIMHTFLIIHGTKFMFSDTPPEMPLNQGDNITIVINSKDVDEIKSVYSKLKEGGSIQMELQETFWSKCYGMLTDKFGIGWQLSYENEQPNT
jgi:PhnB protein